MYDPRSEGEGRIFVWNGVMLSLGCARPTTRQPLEIAFGIALEKPLSVRGDGRSWATTNAIATPSNLRFESNSTSPVLSLFVDPHLFGMRLPHVTELPRSVVAEVTDARHGAWSEARAAHAASCIVRWLRSVSSSLRVDSRVRRLAERLTADALTRPTLDDASAYVGLSTDWAGRLFREQIGASIPAYRLWRQLQRVAKELGAGVTATEAAHAAGFADGAHLSRVTRRFYGITPRLVQSWRPRAAPLMTFGF